MATCEELLAEGKIIINRPEAGDVRLDTPWWDYFDADTMPGWLHRLDSVRELLTVGSRTLVQGALGYVLALDPSIIPLPGIRTEQQALVDAELLALSLGIARRGQRHRGRGWFDQ